MIKIREKDLLFIIINTVMFLFSLSYVILYWLSHTAIEMSETLLPLETSGMFVFLTFARIIFVVALVLVIFADLWWIFREFKEWYCEYRRENL